jgi:hypothetical protein
MNTLAGPRSLHLYSLKILIFVILRCRRFPTISILLTNNKIYTLFPIKRLGLALANFKPIFLKNFLTI